MNSKLLASLCAVIAATAIVVVLKPKKVEPTDQVSVAPTPASSPSATVRLASATQAWAPKKATLMTRWAAKVDPNQTLPEYPRPQMTRSQWQNLNGVWEFQSGNEGDAIPVGKKLASQILVPFAVESALSGVMEHHERVWYRRNFSVPSAWQGKQLKLNFGAVDYESEVFVNGKSVGVHKGGYEPFSYDIAPYLKGNGPQELIVRVFDPTDLGGQPRGKQTTKPAGIMYTPTTGIWQTVWLEPVAKAAIQDLHIIPDVDISQIRIRVNATGASPQSRVALQIKDGGRVVKSVSVAPNVETAIPLQKPKLWSPDAPFLYDVSAALMQNGVESDRVASYFGMRKISIGPVGGVQKMLLNNKFVFQMGPLDQGFWPDGLYTAPTDEALKSDIVAMKQLGFNMVRKHIKVEPARWYYHADRLGILVWQDMPSANSYTDKPAPLDKPAYEKQLDAVIKAHWNSPAIVSWVIFNEGQGRHDTRYLTERAKRLDPSRLTNRDSGGGNDSAQNDGDVGDIDDVHSYPPPASPARSATQALVCGEYGGIAYLIKDHTWNKDAWGYTSVKTPRDLEDLYGEFTELLQKMRDEKGLSAAVYTEITDVEIESNGLLTYDRIPKCDAARIRLANRFAYPVPQYVTVVPTSEKVSQPWQYTTSMPTSNWVQPDFNVSKWKTGPGGFGTANTPGIGKLGTTWNTPDIWMRRTFDAGKLGSNPLVVRDYHDEDVEVFINGVLAYKSGGFIGAYESKPITAQARAAIRPGAKNVLAVHCHQNEGGQYIDVGISQRIADKK